MIATATRAPRSDLPPTPPTATIDLETVAHAVAALDMTWLRQLPDSMVFPIGHDGDSHPAWVIHPNNDSAAEWGALSAHEQLDALRAATLCEAALAPLLESVLPAALAERLGVWLTVTPPLFSIFVSAEGWNTRLFPRLAERAKLDTAPGLADLSAPPCRPPDLVALLHELATHLHRAPSPQPPPITWRERRVTHYVRLSFDWPDGVSGVAADLAIRASAPDADAEASRMALALGAILGILHLRHPHPSAPRPERGIPRIAGMMRLTHLEGPDDEANDTILRSFSSSPAAAP